MIVTRTPLRISFAGGGTDLPAFYEQEPGACFSATITAYMYICVTHKFTGDVRVGYSKTENVGAVKDLEHDIARETLKYCGIDRAVEVVSVADVPAGTGLGSSSAYTVGLLKALYAFHGDAGDNALIARNACEIEIEKCGHPIGKQDQYASACGGLRLYEFFPKGVGIGARMDWPKLSDNLMLFYLGQTRDANGLLKQQPIDWPLYREMGELAQILAGAATDKNLDAFARAMQAAWELKRRVAHVNPEVDDLLELAKKHGAKAGKLCGAGGSGFLLLFVPPECHDRVRSVLNIRPRRELRFKFEREGSQVIHVD